MIWQQDIRISINQLQSLLHPRLEDRSPFKEETCAGNHFGWRGLVGESSLLRVGRMDFGTVIAAR
jgi:hypothetical protein